MSAPQNAEFAAVELPNACGNCGDCFHPVVGPDTDGEPSEWCRDCGCDAAAHDRIERLYPPAEMPHPGCVQYASCEPGDHTYSWPCALAEYPRNPPAQEASDD